MSIKIYTKTGDKGRTSLIGGTKVPKSHLRIECYGTIDELNANIGWLNDLLKGEGINSILREIQDRLFTIGSSLACDPDKAPNLKIPDLKESDISLLENEIDAMSKALPEMKSFILPGGHIIISASHIARCICRRAERNCVNMQEQKLYIDPLIIKYLNRLSDYLFVLGRFAGSALNIEEIAWQPRI